MPQVQCTGKDEIIRTFHYTYEQPSMLGEPHTFFIASDPLPPSNNRFQMTLVDIDNDNLCLEMSKHYDEEVYASMGIAEAMIPVIASAMNKNVRSSSGTDLGSGHYRLPRATAYWKRTAGATYNEAEDVFTYPRPELAAVAEVAATGPVAAEQVAPTTEVKEKKDEAGHESNG